MNRAETRKALGRIAAGGGPEGRRAIASLNALDGITLRASRSNANTDAAIKVDLPARIARLEAGGRVGKLLASRPDISPAVRHELEGASFEVVRKYLNAHPCSSATTKATKDREDLARRCFSAAVGIGTRAQVGPTREELAERMGVATPKPIASFDGTVQRLRAVGVEGK